MDFFTHRRDPFAVDRLVTPDAALAPPPDAEVHDAVVGRRGGVDADDTVWPVSRDFPGAAGLALRIGREVHRVDVSGPIAHDHCPPTLHVGDDG
jgi:hypothetical protein